MECHCQLLLVFSGGEGRGVMFQESLVLKLKKGEKIITFLLMALSNIFWVDEVEVRWWAVWGVRLENLSDFLRPILGRRSLLVGQRA